MSPSADDASAGDTPPDVADVQISRWRAMSPGEKAALVSGLSVAVHQLAQAGIARRYPGASPRERFLRLAVLRLGADLAVAAYPDAAGLEP